MMTGAAGAFGPMDGARSAGRQAATAKTIASAHAVPIILAMQSVNRIGCTVVRVAGLFAHVLTLRWREQ